MKAYFDLKVTFGGLVKQVKKPILLFLFALLQSSVFGAITVKIKSDTTRACAPAQINFMDSSTSTNGPIVYWLWDFGNGGVSTLKNPARAYPNNGSFTIKLTVSDGIDTVQQIYSNYIRIFRGPTALFSFTELTKCLPVNVAFVDNSTAGDGKITKWEWDYGDFSPKGSSKNSTHGYTNRGTYSVILKVIDTNGCQGEVQRLNIIVVDPPKAQFTGANISDCQAPLTSVFTNSSVGKPPLTYQWYFGDGSNSTSANPTHTYSTAGIYDVMLIATDINNCKDTLNRKRYVSIGVTKADFSGPDTVCIAKAVHFTNQSIGAKNFNWSFGTLGTSTNKSPTYVFYRSGWHSVKLVANSGPTCIDSITKSIYVDSVKADFTATMDSICKPQLFMFRDKSYGNVGKHFFKWLIPYNNYHSYDRDTSFFFPTIGCAKATYIITDSVVSKFGCVSVVTKPIEVYKEQINITTNAALCVPTTAAFSQSNCLRFKPVRYSWNFGTGNPADTSNLASPTNIITITTPGSFVGSLTIWDSAGCKVRQPISYSVGAKQHPSFVWNKDTVCYDELVVFKSTSTDSTKITSYTWEVTSGVPGTGKNYYLPARKLGAINVKLTVYQYGCKADTSLNKVVWVSGPIVSTAYINDCINPLKYIFTNHITGGYNRHYTWLGDTSKVDSNNLTFNHTYATAGTYTYKFKAINDTTKCVDSASFKISPIPLKAVIDMSDTIWVCSGTVVQFDGSKSVGVYGLWYHWDFGDGFTKDFDKLPDHTYDSAGLRRVMLVVFNVDSCSDTTYKYVYVNKPQARFFLPSVICHGDSLTITDTSIVQSSVTWRNWFFDGSFYSSDKVIGIKTLLYTDTLFPKKNMWLDTMLLELQIRDKYGCGGLLEQPIYFTKIVANYQTNDSTICRRDTIEFLDTNLQMPGAKFIYHFGDGDTTTMRNPRHGYANSGVYHSKYIVEGNGCKDSLIIPISVQGIDSVGMWATLTDTTCYPATTFFNDVSIGDSIKWRIWDFGDGTIPIRSPLKNNLTKTFLKPGKFSVLLTVETSYGCMNSVRLDSFVNIKGPYARFEVSPDSVCTFEEVVFKVDSLNSYTHYLEWDFADGRLDSTDVHTTIKTHKYSIPGNLLTVLVYSDSNRSCKKFRSVPLVVENVIADFNISPDTIGCMPFKVDFTDKGQRGNLWKWNMNDGNVSSIPNPKNEFKQAGTYQVELMYENTKNSCKDTLVKQIVVHQLPHITAKKDTVICFGDSASLSAFGGATYSWNPTQFVRFPLRQHTKTAPEVDVTYKVLGTDTNGCVNEASVLVRVLQEPQIFLQADTTIIIGEEFKVNVNFFNASVWKWTPGTGLSCTDCPNPLAFPLEATRYKVLVSDSLGCFTVERNFLVNVEQKFSIDVPDAFTPNGDGENDLIYPAGWGIAEILEFKIFNRWGELVFEASPSIPAWDGYYKNELQNMDTFIYFVKATGYDGETYTKEGYLTLLR